MRQNHFLTSRAQLALGPISGPKGPSLKFFSQTLPSFLAFLLISSFFLTGCGLSRPYPTIRTFDLEDLSALPIPSKVRRPLMIQITSSGAAPQYETRKLVYKIGPNEFSEDFYNELVGLPSRLIAAKLSGYLEASSNRFRATQGVMAQSPDLTLDLYLTAFYGDFSLNPHKATVELKATLTDQRSSRPRTLMSNSYAQTRPLNSNSTDRAATLAEALSQALKPILADIADDLNKAISGPRN
ncbi:MAG: PqiC family protein [Deltaproteobacteria bacterium]|nr:PqiC family protein [Deltaproteobacteria bacterium]